MERIVTDRIKNAPDYLLVIDYMQDNSYIFKKDYCDEEYIFWSEVCEFYRFIKTSNIISILQGCIGTKPILMDNAEPLAIEKLKNGGINVIGRKLALQKIYFYDVYGMENDKTICDISTRLCNIKQQCEEVIRKINCLVLMVLLCAFLILLLHSSI